MSATWRSAAHHRQLLSALNAVDGASELLASRAASPRLLASDALGASAFLVSRVNSPAPESSSPQRPNGTSNPLARVREALTPPRLPSPLMAHALPPVLQAPQPLPAVPTFVEHVDPGTELNIPELDWLRAGEADASSSLFWSSMPLGSEVRWRRSAVLTSQDLGAWESYTASYAASLR